jgi:hypothetical protein
MVWRRASGRWKDGDGKIDRREKREDGSSNEIRMRGKKRKVHAMMCRVKEEISYRLCSILEQQ